MKGSIVRRRRQKGGKEYLQLYVVYDAGVKWSEKKQRMVRNQVWERVEPNTRTAAQKLLNIRLAEVQRGDWHGPRGITFSELATSWLAKDVEHRVKPQSVALYRQHLRNHILPTLGSLQVHTITTEHLQGLASSLLTSGGSPVTVRGVLTTAKAVLRKGYEWGYLKLNPADFKVRFPTQHRKAIEPLTPEEIQRLLAHATNKWQPLLVVAIWTGLRIGEIQAMKWDNLDRERREYNVRENMTRLGPGTPKTARSAATVKLSPFVIETLASHKQRQAALKLAQGRDYKDRGFIFATRSGSHYGYSHVVEDGLKATLARASMRIINFHQLRHTCASLMIAHGANIKIVQRQLRHSTIKQTMDTYAHLYPEDLDEAVRSMDGFVWGASLVANK